MASRTLSSVAAAAADPNDMLSIPDIMRIAQVGESTVYRWINSGRLARVNLGTEKRPKTRIKRSVLDAFFNSRTIPGRKAA